LSRAKDRVTERGGISCYPDPIQNGSNKVIGKRGQGRRRIIGQRIKDGRDRHNKGRIRKAGKKGGERIPHSHNSGTRKEAMFDVLDSATYCAPIGSDISPRFQGIPNTNGAVQNEP